MSATTCPECGAQVTVPEPPGGPVIACAACGAVVPVPAAPAAEEPPAQEVPSYPVTRFAPAPGGNVTGNAAVVAGAVGVGGAVVLGALAGLLRMVFWMVLVFPLLLGAAVGLIAGLGARLARLRAPGPVGQVAVVAALVAVVAMHYSEYLRLTVQAPQLGQMTFLDYLEARARVGVKIGRAAGDAGGGMNLGYVGSMVYWAVEAALAAVAAFAIGRSLVDAPFCPGCNNWKAKLSLGPYRVHPQVAVAAFTAGTPAGIAVPAEGDRRVTLVVHHCPRCGPATPIDVQLTATEPAGKGSVMYQAFLTYPGDALAAFEDLDRACREQGLVVGK